LGKFITLRIGLYTAAGDLSVGCVLSVMFDSQSQTFKASVKSIHSLPMQIAIKNRGTPKTAAPHAGSLFAKYSIQHQVEYK
jgi:hypothetical protein